MFEYFAEEVRAQTSIRDYLEGEKAVQTLHLVYMNLTNYFVIYPEQELNKGYGDLWMSPNFLNHPEMQYSYVVEFKYVKHDAGEAEVAAKLEEAREQLRQYAGTGSMRRRRGIRRCATSPWFTVPGNWQPWKRLFFNDVGSILFCRRRATVMVLFRKGGIS